MRSAPAQPAVPGKASGAGTVQACGVAEFEFDIQRKVKTGKLSGKLKYSDPSAGMKLKSTSYTSFEGAGNSATIRGACKLNGASCSFEVYIEDNGDPGTSDVFRISIDGNPFLGGTLLSGNIKIS